MVGWPDSNTGSSTPRVEASGEQSEVRCLLEDREGNLWMGGSHGLMRLRDDVFRVYGKEEGPAER